MGGQPWKTGVVGWQWVPTFKDTVPPPPLSRGCNEYISVCQGEEMRTALWEGGVRNSQGQGGGSSCGRYAPVGRGNGELLRAAQDMGNIRPEHAQYMPGHPLHMDNRKKWQKKNSCQGKHREFGIFVKTQAV